MGPTELAIVLLSALLHATWNTATKGSSNPMAFLLAMEVVTALAALALLPFFSLADVPTEAWKLLGATWLVHGCYGYFLTSAYAREDLTVVYPIARTTPALVPLVAVPLLGERISLVGGLGIALVVAGMWLVQTQGRLRARDFSLAGAGFAYLTLLTTVAYSLIDKQTMGVLDGSDWTGPAPRSVVLYFLITAGHVPVFAALALRRLDWRQVVDVGRGELRGVLGGVVAGFVSYTLILEALRTASVSYVVAVRQASVLFAVAMAVIWLGERPSRLRLAGGFATVLGVAMIALWG